MNLSFCLDHTVSTFMAGITHIIVQLRNLDVRVTDNQIIAKILTSLPPSFKHFGAAWDSTPEDQRTLPNLKTRLVKEERAIKSLHSGKADPVDVAYFGSSTNPAAQAASSLADHSVLPQAFPAGNFNNFRGGKARGGRGGSYRGRGGFSNGGGFHPYASGKRGSHSGYHQREGSNSNIPICHYCNKPGHIQRNCWDKQQRDRQSQNDGDQKSYSYQSISISLPKRYSL